MLLHLYLPKDRLHALSDNSSLPDRTIGSALLADISGFTALTERLRDSLGPRRGAEELSRLLDEVYTPLIDEVERYGGSVTGFAGDAIICWFDAQASAGQPTAAANALSAAQGMQGAIQAFPTLALKVAIASGSVRRFLVGDPAIHYLDVLAGATVTRTALGEHLAGKGEVLVDQATVQLLGDSISIQELRTDGESGEKFAILRQSPENRVRETALNGRQPLTLDLEILRPFIHPIIFERETSQQSPFMTEFRPCAALFVRFTGIDYEADDAQAQLDAFIRQVQTIAFRYEGYLLQLTIGDKGSYAYINFGALSAHEDDTRRAVKTAIAIREASELTLQMGITQGLLRVGAYGGQRRKTFGALGDDVNLAARLMSMAGAGEILVSNRVHKAVAQQVVFEPRSPLPMKGKAEPLPVFAMTGERKQRAVRLQEPAYTLPMVGRAAELQVIADRLDLALQGQGQVIGIVAEAGLGKSRLVAEAIRLARQKCFAGFGGACQSDGIHSPYLAWKPIWQAFFDIDPEVPSKRQMRLLEGELEERAPARLEAMPLLNSLLDLNIPENEFTQNLEPKIRQSALHALLEDCLKAAAQEEPILIVIEDLHWIDAVSHDLLEGLAKALANYGVCFLLAYRPPQLERLQAPRLEALPHFTRIDLHELNHAEAESAIRSKLAQLYPARGGALPAQLVDSLMARAQGNPFYLEELLNYLRDRGLDPRDPADLEMIALPDSLHALILSRIDRLSEQEKTTLRAASIVGRLFQAWWLAGYYPELGGMPQVKAALDELDALDITPLDSGPELTYLFKHIVTHEVTYESLPFATRARLHEMLAGYLESAYPDSLPLEALAFHYGHSENNEKQRLYLRKAGDAAQKNFANDAALDYYKQLLSLIEDEKEMVEIQLKCGEVLELIGKWDEAEIHYRSALELAGGDPALKAGSQFALGKLNRMRGDFELALGWLANAKEASTALDDRTGLARVLTEIGAVLWRKGDYVQALKILNDGLALARGIGEKSITASALNLLGLVSYEQGDYNAALTCYEESLAIQRLRGDKAGIIACLGNKGTVAFKQGDYETARMYHEETKRLIHEIGQKWGMASSLTNLGVVAVAQADYPAAWALYEESHELFRELGDKWGMALSLINLGVVARAQKDYIAARRLFEESLALSKQTDLKVWMPYALLYLGIVDLAENQLEARGHIVQSLRLRQEAGEQQGQTASLIGVAGLVLFEGNPQFAAQLLGAVDAALTTLSAAIEPEVKDFHAQTLAAAREQLGEAAFRSAWEEGSSWSLEQAVSMAVDE